MAQAQQNPQTVQAPAEDENHIIAERRAKLAALRAAGVTEVDVVGLAESHCVACTAVDAARADFKTRVLRELTAPVSEQLGEQAREWMMTEGVALV